MAKDENADDNDCMEVGQMRLGHPRPAESDPSLLWVRAISKGIHNPLLMKHRVLMLMRRSKSYVARVMMSRSNRRKSDEDRWHFLETWRLG